MAEKIGFVGLGRMGANMARRLRDQGYAVTAVFDTRVEVAEALAHELGSEACRALARVTELSDVIVTVVSDDEAMEQIFAPKGDSLLQGARGRLFINCATLSPEDALRSRAACGQGRRPDPRSVHGFQHPASA